MEVLEAGKRYVVKDSEGKEIIISFFHKDTSGKPVHGIMSEDLMEVLIHRQSYFVVDLNRASMNNINILTHLKQAFGFMKTRNFAKLLKRKKVDNTADTI